MVYVKFLNEEKLHYAKVYLSDEIVTLTFSDPTEPNLSGFDVFLDVTATAQVGGDTYHKATTLYKKIDDFTYQLSLDGSVYVEPPIVVTFVAGEGGSLDGDTEQTVDYYSELIVPTPKAANDYEFVEWSPAIPSVGTVDESQTFTAIFKYNEPIDITQENKVREMNIEQQKAIREGVDVTLTDGTVKRFSLATNDQLSIISSLTSKGTDKGMPWHIIDESIHSEYFSKEDIELISNAAHDLIQYHVAYFRDLRIYIRSLTDKDAIQAIEYGVYIPEEYQSEVLKDYLNAIA